MGCPRATLTLTLTLTLGRSLASLGQITPEASLTLYPIEMVAPGIMCIYSLETNREPLYNPVIPFLFIQKIQNH